MKHVESFFFGSDDHLFGMYHPPIGHARNHGVVVCAPLFHEFYRSHLALRQVAIGLAQKGYDVLRFDYSGIGDSKGDIPQDMFNVWSAEIGVAMAEIRQLCGCKNITLFTTRFSASLGLPWRPTAARYVCWDSIPDYMDYMRQLDATHSASLAEHRTMSSDEKNQHTEGDFLGTRWSRKAVSEMLAAFAARSDAKIQGVDPAKLVDIQSDVNWVSASLKMIYAHETVKQISDAI